MIQISPEHRLTISFTRDDDGDDISTFVNIIEKCNKESKKAGFKNLFSEDEKAFVRVLHENLNKE